MKNIQTFEQFVNESKTNETLYEASFGGRAWSGKLSNIDNLFSWMYEKGIITKSEQKEKDRVFRQYYRYYNDGDFPRALSSLGISKYAGKTTVENALEQYLEGYIKKILAKYAGKYDRTDFRIDTLLSDLHTLKHIIDENEVYGVLSLFNSVYTKTKIDNPEFDTLMAQLRKEYDSLNAAVNAKITASADALKDVSSYARPSSSHTLSYRKSQMENYKIWDSKLEAEYEKMVITMKKMSEIVQTAIEATNKLKQEIGN